MSWKDSEFSGNIERSKCYRDLCTFESSQDHDNSCIWKKTRLFLTWEFLTTFTLLVDSLQAVFCLASCCLLTDPPKIYPTINLNINTPPTCKSTWRKTSRNLFLGACLPVSWSARILCNSEQWMHQLLSKSGFSPQTKQPCLTWSSGQEFEESFKPLNFFSLSSAWAQGDWPEKHVLWTAVDRCFVPAVFSFNQPAKNYLYHFIFLFCVCTQHHIPHDIWKKARRTCENYGKCYWFVIFKSQLKKKKLNHINSC